MNEAVDGDLSGVLADIAAVAGRDAALRLAAAYGGTRIKIPGRLRSGGWLVRCVGEEAARAIIEHYRVFDADGRTPATVMVLPIGWSGSITRARRAATKAAVQTLEAGGSVREAARRAGVAERTAWRIARRLKVRDPRQGDLF
jgi:hypothetical protein